MSDRPETYTLDITGANGTPFRFTYWPDTDKVTYQDRRHPSQPGEPLYKPFFYDENGQICGPALDSSAFTRHGNTGMRGWHEVDAWDVDRATMSLIGDWIELIKEADPR